MKGRKNHPRHLKQAAIPRVAFSNPPPSPSADVVSRDLTAAFLRDRKEMTLLRSIRAQPHPPLRCHGNAMHPHCAQVSC